MTSRGGHNYSSLRTGEFDEESNSTLVFADRRLKDQDSNLESLGRSVARLGELSLTISKEIDTQNKLLTSLETDVERSQETTDSVMKKTKELVAKSGGTKIVCTIVALVAVLVVLVLMVIYT